MKKRAMEKRKNRLNTIIELLHKNGKINIKEIAGKLQVSEMTIRRDLIGLENENIIKRIHGGAILFNSSTAATEGYIVDEQTEKKVRQKSIIGKKASTLITPNETIFLDAGTTTPFIAKYLDRELAISVLCYTNIIASEFYTRKNTNLILVGGYFHRDSSVFHSKEGCELIKNIRADTAFISAAGIDFNLGLTTYYYFEADLKKAMIDSAKKIILVADSSKFGKISVTYFANLKQIHTIITDSGITDSFKKKVEDLGIELIIPG